MTDDLCPQPCMCPSCYDFEEARDFLEWQKRRADLSPSPEVVKELVEALREARSDLASYIDHDYPPDTCAAHPSVARQHFRDMELCRRIDAVLAKLEGGE